MELKWATRENVDILAISGKIDSSTAPELSRQIETEVAGHSGNLVIDFSEVTYISSAGLRVVIKTSHLLAAGNRKVILCGLKDYVREVFDLAGLSKLLDIRADVETACS